MTNEECIKCGKQLKRKRLSGMCNSCVKIGRKMSNETREKMRIKALGNKRSLGIKRSKEVKKRISDGHKGEKSVFWKGDDVGYNALHSWLIRELGPASYCSNDITHKAKRYEWANISREYKRDLNDYKPLCPSCHRKFDFTEEIRNKLRKNNIGNKNASKSIRQILTDGFRDFESIYDAELITGILHTSIANVLAGRSKTAGGYKWIRI